MMEVAVIKAFVRLMVVYGIIQLTIDEPIGAETLGTMKMMTHSIELLILSRPKLAS